MVNDVQLAGERIGQSQGLGKTTIIALIIPPLAMFLYEGAATSRFWISLILMLLAIPLWGALGGLALLASIIYTLYIILTGS